MEDKRPMGLDSNGKNQDKPMRRGLVRQTERKSEKEREGKMRWRNTDQERT